MHPHAGIEPGQLAFVAKLLSRGGPSQAVHPLAALASAQHLELVPGVDGAGAESVVQLAFMLAPIHPLAIAPERGDDPRSLAAFGVQLLADAAQAGNPVRRRFLARDVDSTDGPSLAGYEEDVRAMVRAVGTPTEPTDRTLSAPHAKSPRDFWGDDWHAEVAQAVDAWRGVSAPRESWLVLLCAAEWTSHLSRIPPPFGTRARLAHPGAIG